MAHYLYFVSNAEFKYGIGPETRTFGENSVLTTNIKDFYLVEEGRKYFYETRSKYKNNTNSLYLNPVKLKEKITDEGPFIGDFGITGIPKAGINLAKQYIGGFYLELIPDKEGKNMDMILYNDVNLKSLVLHYMYINDISELKPFPEKFPREKGKITPLGETKQILKWKEAININKFK